VVEHLGVPYRVTALAARKSVDRLLAQAQQVRPAAVAIADEASCDAGASALRELGAEVYRGAKGLVEMVARDDVDIVVAAIVGAAGLPAALAAVGAGKTLALANKEALVVAGSLLMPLARSKKVPILPVDSEHSAIFQAMQAGRRQDIKRVILTASGGPFRNTPLDTMRDATLADALAHPTWKMGNKVTIDSATMFNKGLELIEACWLFDLKPEQVEIVIHPESIVHSMVEFVDGSTIAQLSPPDMRTPIQYALTYPDRLPGPAGRMDFAQSLRLNFEPPDRKRFPAIDVAYDVATRGGTLGAVMNAANEAAVGAFVGGWIGFGEICETVQATIAAHRFQTDASLDDLLEADRWAREYVETMIAKRVRETSICIRQHGSNL